MAKIITTNQSTASMPTVSSGKSAIFVDDVSKKVCVKDDTQAVGVLASEDVVDSKIAAWVVYASDAEVKTWTEAAKIISPKTLKDNYTNKYYSSVGSSDWNNWTISFTHWLWAIPKYIKLTLQPYEWSSSPVYQLTSIWTYNWSAYTWVGSAKISNPGYALTTKTDRIGVSSNWTNGSVDVSTKVTVTTYDDTNVILTNTVYTWGWYSATGYYYLLEAFA